MTDKEITREKTFSEELLYFKERIEEVFDNYNNPNGNEDPLYICVLRDSKRIVRKAEEEITRQQTEIERLKECPKCVYEYDGEVTEYCVQGPCPNSKTVEQIKVEAYKEFAERIKLSIKANVVETLCNDVRGVYKAEYVLDDIDNLLKEFGE